MTLRRLFSKLQRRAALKKARQAQSIGDWQAAALAYEHVLTFAPSASVWLRYGIALEETGELDRAALAYRAILDTVDTMSEVHFRLSGVLQRQGKYEAAAQSLQRAAELDPQGEAGQAYSGNVCRPAYWCELGDAAAAEGRWAEATAAYEQALALDASAGSAWVSYASALRRWGRHVDAEAACNKAVALLPGSPAPYLERGQTRRKRRKMAEAIGDLRTAILLGFGQAPAETAKLELENEGFPAPSLDEVANAEQGHLRTLAEAVRAHDWPAALQAIDGIPDTEQTPAIRFLHGCVLAALDRKPEAEAAFRRLDGTGPTLRLGRGRRARIAWLIPTLNPNVASTRYRCFHMAMALEAMGLENSFHTRPEALTDSIEKFDAIIIVKRIDPSIVRVVTTARERGIPAFLDLCDDILSVDFARGGYGSQQMIFRAIAPKLNAVVTTCTAMARRLRQHVRDFADVEVPVHIIPDIAETREISLATDAFVQNVVQACRPCGGAGAALPPPFHVITRPAGSGDPDRPRRVLWFGNHGAPHSNFGIMSLLQAAPALRAVHAAFPLELVVVSSQKERFTSMIEPLGFPTKWVEWTRESIYKQLAKADVALLTSGDDKFCEVKSANRALQALAAGVPVVATGNEAFEELKDCLVLDDFELGLRTYLGPDREDAVATALGRARERLSEFSLAAAGASWIRRIETALAETAAERRVIPCVQRTLFMVEAGTRFSRIEALLTQAWAQGEDPKVLLAPEAALAEPRWRDLFIATRRIPMMISGDDAKKADMRWLNGVSKVIMEDHTRPISSAVATWAMTLGIPAVTLDEYEAELGTAPPTEDALELQASHDAFAIPAI